MDVWSSLRGTILPCQGPEIFAFQSITYHFCVYAEVCENSFPWLEILVCSQKTTTTTFDLPRSASEGKCFKFAGFVLLAKQITKPVALWCAGLPKQNWTGVFRKTDTHPCFERIFMWSGQETILDWGHVRGHNPLFAIPRFRKL